MSSVHFEMSASCFSQSTGSHGAWWTLANRMLPALCLLLYRGVCSYFFHSPGLTNLISLQKVEDDGQMCHFMSWIVPFQSQFKGLSLPYCDKYSFVVQQYPVGRDYCAFLPLCCFSPRAYTDLIQATQTIESAQLMKQKTPTWDRNLPNNICLKGFLMWDYTPKTTSSFGKSIQLVTELLKVPAWCVCLFPNLVEMAHEVLCNHSGGKNISLVAWFFSWG